MISDRTFEVLPDKREFLIGELRELEVLTETRSFGVVEEERSLEVLYA